VPGSVAYRGGVATRDDDAVTLRFDREFGVAGSLGATLYESLTLRTPFESASREALFQNILTEEPPPVGRRNRNLPRDLCTVVETAMAKDRERRYRTAADFAEDLRRVREDLPIEASPVGPVTRTLRWCQRNRTVAALSLALFVVMGIALGLSLRGWSDSEAARLQLKNNLADILDGKESKREKELQDLILLSWQKLYSADPKKALPLLDRIAKLDPANVEAIAARTWLYSTEPHKALAVLDEQMARLDSVDPELSWLRAQFLRVLYRRDEAEVEAARAGDRETPLRFYFLGLARVKGFMAGSRSIPPSPRFGGCAGLCIGARATRRKPRAIFARRSTATRTAPTTT
jgi:hypothetical protein